MDILTHSLTGVAIGTILVNFTKNGFFEKAAIILFSAIGAVFPDIDAISLWLRFDNTFGEIFGLTQSGDEIYFSKFWYSHHAFFHSLFACILTATLLMIVLHFLCLSIGAQRSLLNFIGEHFLIALAFLLGYLMHLLGDLPTPSAVWGGINLFWPSQTYIGGTGKIWWWNNYDIFLLIVGCITANTMVYIVGGYYKINRKQISVLLGLFCFILIEIQINTRPICFNYLGQTKKYEKMEAESKQIQKIILGKKIYGFMEKLDNKLFINF